MPPSLVAQSWWHLLVAWVRCQRTIAMGLTKRLHALRGPNAARLAGGLDGGEQQATPSKLPESRGFFVWMRTSAVVPWETEPS